MEGEPASDYSQDQVRASEIARFHGVVRPLCEEDLPKIKPILEAWIKDSETGEPIPQEVEEDLSAMRESIEGQNDRAYLVADEDEKVLGMVGFKTIDERLKEYANTDNPVEPVNLYLDPRQRGRGLGRALMDALEQKAREEGFEEIVFCSGPRFRDTAWGFYDHLPGYLRVAVAKDYFGEGTDAPVWRKELKN